MAALRPVTVHAFAVPTGGMERTLLSGDSVLADNTPFTPRPGDIVTFLFPEDRRLVFIKRVIGLPGETVEVRGRAALVYFSREVPREEPAPPGRIRWERIGQRLR